MSYNLGVAEGHIDLNLDDLKNASIQAAKELQKIGDAGLLAKSEFNRLEAASKGMAGTFESARRKSESLTKQIDNAKQKTEAYRNGIKELNNLIDASKQQQTNLETAIKKSTERLDKARQKYGETSDQAQKYRDEISRMEIEHNILGKQIEDCENKVVKYKTSLNDTETEIINLTRKLKDAESSMLTFGDAAQKTGDKLKSIGDSMNKVGSTMSMALTAPLTAAAAYSAKSAIEFESAYTGVTKTVEGTKEQLATLRQGIIDMSKELPSSTTEISAVAEAAGQLGIETDNVLSFSKAMIDLGNSTNLTAEEGATQLARFANITNMSQKDFDRLGASIVDLGNNFATTEQEIVDMAIRLAGAGSQIGLTQGEIMGFATALSSVGIQAEMGGSAFSKAMVRMQVACETGLTDVQKLTKKTGYSLRDLQLMSQNATKDFTALADELGMTKGELQKLVNSGVDLQNFADVAGVTSEQFVKAYKEDAAEALQLFIHGLGNTEKSGESTIKMLQDMGFTEVRLRDSMTRLANSGDLVTEAVKMGNTAWEENTALVNEANKRYDTTESKLKIAKNRISDSARIIGEQMIPIVSEVTTELADLAERFGELDPAVQKNIIKMGALVAATGPVLKIVGGATSGIGKLVKGTGGLIKDLGKISAAKNTAKAIGEIGTFSVKSVEGVSGLSKVLSKFASPGGAAVLAAGAVVGISTALWKLYEDSLDAKIAAQFGNIKLSAEEVEDVAKRITTTDWTMKLDATIEAQSKLKEFEKEIEDSVSTLDKLDWKVSVGLELTEEEKQSYKDAMTSFVKSATDYVEQQHYTVSLALQATLDPSSTTYEQLAEFSNSYYSSSEAKIKELGEKIADLLTKSTTATAFDKEKYQAEIKEAQQQMYDLIQELAGEDLEAEIANMRLSYEGQGLGIDKESFEKLNAQIAENIQNITDKSSQPRRVTIKQINAKYDEDVKAGMLLGKSKEEAEKYAQAIKDKAIKEIELNMAKEKSQVAIGGLEFSLGNIPQEYQDALSGFEPEIDKIFQNHTSKLATAYNGNTNQMMSLIMGGITDSSKKLTDGERKFAKQIYEGLKPQKERLQQIADQYIKAGQSVPDCIKKGIADINRWGVAAEQTDAMWEYMASSMSNSPEYLTALKKAIEQGKDIPESVTEQIKIYTGEVYNAQKGVWEKVALAGDASTTMLEQSVSATVTAIRDVALNRITQVTPDITEKMSTLGFDTGKSFNDNIAAGVLNNIEVIEDSATGAITGFKNKSKDKVVEVTPELVSVMEALGVNMNVGAGKGLSSRVLNAPDIEDPNGEEYGKKWLQDIQKGLEKGVTVDINTGKITYPKDFVGPLPNGAVRAHADGGFITQPEIGLIGEAGPESIIPLSPTKRSRAIDLWEETGEILGVRAAATKLLEDVAAQQAAQEYMASRPLKSSTFGGIDYDLLADKLAKKLRESPIKTEATITVQNDLTVDLDGEVVGRKVTPTVSRIIANRSKM